MITQATPNILPPVRPKEVKQPDVFENMFQAIMSGELENFTNQAQEARAAVGEILIGDDDLDYVTFDHEEPQAIHRTPAEQDAMEIWRRTPKTPESAPVVE